MASKSFVTITSDLNKAMGTLRNEIPDTMHGFSAMHKGAMSAGVLSELDKELLALAIGVTQHCDGCIGFHVKALIRLGVTREQLMETLGSVVAWQAIPHFATYAASNAFVRSFSEALHYELAPHRIVVTCLCPGGTHSEFHAIAGAGPKQGLAAAAMLSSEEVAERGVAAMLRGKKTLVTGALNKLSCFFTGLAPRGLASRASAPVLGPPPAPAETERPPARGEP